MGAKGEPRWSEAVRLPGGASADWAAGEDPEAAFVEVLFADRLGLSCVVHALGSSVEAAVAASTEEARRFLGCEAATVSWRAA